LGDRQKNIEQAINELANAGVKILKVSSIIETEPVGGPAQGKFLNAALKAQTVLSPQDLLKTIHQIETALGRVRTVKDGPRTIDIDILLYGNLQMDTPELTIPHPRMRERAFVMQPLFEIEPGIEKIFPS